MTNVIKGLIIFAVAWIATMWSGAWTALLMLVALSAMFLGMAAESWYANRDRTLARLRDKTRIRGRA